MTEATAIPASWATGSSPSSQRRISSEATPIGVCANPNNYAQRTTFVSAAIAGSDAGVLDLGTNRGAATMVVERIGAPLQLAPLEPSDIPLPINLASALQLSDARPLIVSAAQASAWVAEAQLQRAKMIKIPELDFGVCYVRHDGFGPDLNHGVNEPTFVPGVGGPLYQDLNWIYIGGSVYGVIPLTDAIFLPLVARQALNAKRHDIQTAKNDALLMTARSYFDVHYYRGQYAAAVEVTNRGHELLRRVDSLSHDLVSRVEVHRVANTLANIEQTAALARQEWRVSSANLTQALRLDPRVLVVPTESDQLQITLIDPSRMLDELMTLALEFRPELAAQRAMIRSAEAVVRQEKNRVVLPTLYLTGFQSPGHMRMQAMVFGLGHGSSMNNFSLREDVSLQAIWQLEGLGFGNLAKIKKSRGDQSEAIVRLRRTQDAVVAEVTRSQAKLQASAVRVVETERSLKAALTTYEGNFEGLGQTERFEDVLVQVYRPQEVVMALERLMQSYTAYFAAIADYNRAQFELFHALGYPARELAMRRPPGDVEPVATERPTYLPPVNTGPPPATR